MLPGKTVRVNRVNKWGDEHPDVCCRLVAHELGFGERLDELFAGTPCLMVVKLLLSVAAEEDTAIRSLHVSVHSRTRVH